METLKEMLLNVQLKDVYEQILCEYKKLCNLV